MADFNYLKSQQSADKLIAKFAGGRFKGKIIRTPLGTGPKSNPGKGIPVEYPATLVVVDWSKGKRGDDEVQRSTRRALVSPLGLSIEIELGDEIVAVDGKRYKIVPPMSILKPATIVVLYDLQVQL